ncbi:hypothetical protein ADUPG1_007939, partial [Aduncisulcus paluster]
MTYYRNSFLFSFVVFCLFGCIFSSTTGFVELLNGVVDESLLNENSFPLECKITSSKLVHIGHCISTPSRDCDASDVSSWTIYDPNTTVNTADASNSIVSDYSIDISDVLGMDSLGIEDTVFSVDFYANYGCEPGSIEDETTSFHCVT